MRHVAIDEPRAFRLLAPRDLEQAIDRAAAPGDPVFLAGGGDLMEQLKTRWRTPSLVIDLNALEPLRGMGPRPNGELRFGALTRLAELARADGLGSEFDALRQAAGRVASPQIRARATLGGNLLQDSRCPYYRGGRQCLRAGGDICDAYYGFHQEHALFGAAGCYTISPSDLAPALVALDARVRVQGPDGARELPLQGLFNPADQDLRRMHRLGPGEVLIEIRLTPRPGRRSAFVKYAPRRSWDFARVSAAAALELENERVARTRIVLGAVAATPWPCADAQAYLLGKALNAETIARAADLTLLRAAPLPGNRYKLPLVRQAVTEVLERLADRPTA